MERRKAARAPGWAQARIRHEKEEFIAVALNISDTGLYIECGIPFEVGSELMVTLHLPDAQDPVLKTEVAWVSKIGCHIPGLNYRIGLGIMEMEHITPEEFDSIKERFTTYSFEQSRLSRLKVVVEDHPEMHGVKPLSLYNGGCYLLLRDGMPEVGEELIVNFHIPGSIDPISYRTRVVYTIDDDHARGLGVNAGFGLQFLEETGGSGQALVAFLGKHEPVFEA